MKDKTNKLLEGRLTTNEEISDYLWQFPCDFLFKAMAYAVPGVEQEIIQVIQRFVPGEYQAKLSPSKKGNYVAVSVTFIATSKSQLDEIYLAVNELENVKVCL